CRRGDTWRIGFTRAGGPTIVGLRARDRGQQGASGEKERKGGATKEKHHVEAGKSKTRAPSQATTFPAPQDYIDTFGKDPLTFKPGQHWAYSNFGYAVLGRIVEAIERKPFPEVMTKRIYEKANMQHSTRLPSAANASDVAVPYASVLPDGKGKLEYRPERDARRFLPLPAPFGCSFTTVRVIDRAELSAQPLGKKGVNRQGRHVVQS
ncbi:MAG: serine hydrolase domain-containing protein, partial [Polyangiaceae bacterium]